MKLFRYAAFVLGLAAITVMSSCATPEERLARRELRTQLNHGAKIVTCNAVRQAALPGKKYFLLFPKNDTYNGMCANALTLSLEHFGFTPAADAAQADFILECSYSTETTVRMRTSLQMIAKKESVVFWEGNFFCRSRPRDCAQYLPGICVSGASWLGKSFSGELNVIKYHRSLLETVYKN